MEPLAEKCIRNGDLEGAVSMYASLEHVNPVYKRKVELLRVLIDPSKVPQPQRNFDICDALLDEHIPPEILLGKNGDADTINKNYQRLVVYVHPDKNTNSRAKDAFQRLGEMKEKANEAFIKRGVIEKFEAQLSAASNPPKNSKQSPSAHFPKLSELKKNKITLTSLRRGVSAESDPFSATTRPFSSVTSPLPSPRQTDLAATVPSMSLDSLPSGNRMPTRPPRKKAGGTAPRSVADTRKRKEKSSLPRDTFTSGKTVGKPETMSSASSSKSGFSTSVTGYKKTPHNLSPLHKDKGLPKEDVVHHPLPAANPIHNTEHPNSEAPVAEPVVADETPFSTQEKSPEAEEPIAATAEEEAADAEEAAAADEIDRDKLREQITAMINGLGQLRRDSTNIRLRTNMSFSAYSKETK
ncbi:hypothetical protein ADEAN_000787000 [Angomonas deanei]|uniref:J domain-containing protein n=1 Tax=Angomonas deanei TaxID=59799 RepID=A0A7G2CLQ8_9TRYP|nr:hypothetical protein ADEAN_000787000 [Angomonas deanei]